MTSLNLTERDRQNISRLLVYEALARAWVDKLREPVTVSEVRAKARESGLADAAPPTEAQLVPKGIEGGTSVFEFQDRTERVLQWLLQHGYADVVEVRQRRELRREDIERSIEWYEITLGIHEGPRRFYPTERIAPYTSRRARQNAEKRLAERREQLASGEFGTFQRRYAPIERPDIVVSEAALEATEQRFAEVQRVLKARLTRLFMYGR